MNKIFSVLAISMSLAALASASAFAAKVGEPAPDFTGKGSDGKTYKLADYKGKWVVLEWHNQGCPYVKKFYKPGAMQALQKEWTGKGVAWFTVLSSAQGKQGHQTAEQQNAYMKDNKAAPTASLMDADGVIGKAYDAKVTPHMFVIDPTGKLVYNGAIDDNDSSDSDDIAKAKNYVTTALTEGMSGKPITTATSKPYGCGVKFK
jgi:peroxiredoxin